MNKYALDYTIDPKYERAIAWQSEIQFFSLSDSKVQIERGPNAKDPGLIIKKVPNFTDSALQPFNFSAYQSIKQNYPNLVLHSIHVSGISISTDLSTHGIFDFQTERTTDTHIFFEGITVSSYFGMFLRVQDMFMPTNRTNILSALDNIFKIADSKFFKVQADQIAQVMGSNAGESGTFKLENVSISLDDVLSNSFTAVISKPTVGFQSLVQILPLFDLVHLSEISIKDSVFFSANAQSPASFLAETKYLFSLKLQADRTGQNISIMNNQFNNMTKVNRILAVIYQDDTNTQAQDMTMHLNFVNNTVVNFNNTGASSDSFIILFSLTCDYKNRKFNVTITNSCFANIIDKMLGYDQSMLCHSQVTMEHVKFSNFTNRFDLLRFNNPTGLKISDVKVTQYQGQPPSHTNVTEPIRMLFVSGANMTVTVENIYFQHLSMQRSHLLHVEIGKHSFVHFLNMTFNQTQVDNVFFLDFVDDRAHVQISNVTVTLTNNNIFDTSTMINHNVLSPSSNNHATARLTIQHLKMLDS